MNRTLATAPGWGHRRRDWATLLVLAAMHVLALLGLAHLAISFSGMTLLLGGVWYLLSGLSITAGYHRLFSHGSYQASPLVRAFLLAFGAAACQRSALKWCSDHRRHHRYTDRDEDPYSVKHGFWWAHVGWVISQQPPAGPNPPDLLQDRLVRWQDRYWIPAAILFGGLLPAAIGMLWGDPLGALLVAGPLRIVLTWHSTYAVNSFAHRFGRRPYALGQSARDNLWVALATLGEGYHNFHHRFPSDYRNGIRWYHYDPTKWLVWLLSRLRLVHGLRRVPQEVIARTRGPHVRRPRRRSVVQHQDVA